MARATLCTQALRCFVVVVALQWLGVVFTGCDTGSRNVEGGLSGPVGTVGAPRFLSAVPRSGCAGDVISLDEVARERVAHGRGKTTEESDPQAQASAGNRLGDVGAP